MAESKVKLEDLIWAREKLRTFSRLERRIRNELGSYGIELLVIKTPLYLILFLFSLFIFSLGVYFWFKERDPFYFITCVLPIASGFFIYHNIKIEKKKNIFRFIGKFPIPEEKFQNIINIVEDYIFEQKDIIEDIISWKASQSIKSDNSKFTYIFNISYWRDISKAKKQLLTLAILMVSLQKFLHVNRKTYEELVKNLPTMNTGYKFDPKKNNKPKTPALNGFTTEDLFTGTGD